MNAEDLESTNFACITGLNVSPISLMTSYNKDTKTLTIKPDVSHPDIKFNEIGLIKFGDDTKEPNFCSQDYFKYTVGSSDVTNDHVWTYHLLSKGGADL